MVWWRAWAIAPKDGPLSRVQSTAAVTVMRAARRLAGDTRLRPHADTATVKYVSHKLRYVAAPIPKCGTKSLKHTFVGSQSVSGDGTEHRCTFEDLLETHPETGGYFRFSFVRNPWDRVVSCYRDKIVNSHTVGKITILSRYPGLAPKMPFEEFVAWLAGPEGQDDFADRHWLSQSVILGKHCDYVGRIETYADDLKKIADRLGLDHIETRHANVTSRESSYRHFYTDKTRALVADRYALDIETFDYAF